MLVLTRKVGESIIIGDNIEITVLDSHSSEIKLGITAPRSVVILRREIYDAIGDENRLAAKLGGGEVFHSAIGEAGRKLERKRQ